VQEIEVLETTEPIRKLIQPQTDSSVIDAEAIGGGMTTMLDDAVAKCRAGLTTVSEVLRVTTVR
jgi:general secretion pathway protein E